MPLGLEKVQLISTATIVTRESHSLKALPDRD